MERRTYNELLKDPRWQKKRLEIMQRDGFQCCLCGDTESTLNVHHKYYIYKKDPWDYPDELLVTLCEYCHKIEEEKKDLTKDFTKVLLSRGYFNHTLDVLLEAILMLNDPTNAIIILRRNINDL